MHLAARPWLLLAGALHILSLLPNSVTAAEPALVTIPNLSAQAASPSASTIATLEQAFLQHPLPHILLAIAALQEESKEGCKEALATYRRFFVACKSCDLQSYAIDRLDAVIERCMIDINEELELRESMAVSKSKTARRVEGDATRQEVVSLLREASRVDRPRSVSLLVALIEAGDKIETRVLNELRNKGWDIVAFQPASVDQVLAAVQRLKRVDFPAHQQMLAQLMKLMSRDQSTVQEELSSLRLEARTKLAQESSGTPERDPALSGCRANSEREWGFLTINTAPWSQISVNGEKLGSTPIAHFEVLAGCSSVRAVDPETGVEILKNVTVRANKTAILNIDMRSGSDQLRYQ